MQLHDFSSAKRNNPVSQRQYRKTNTVWCGVMISKALWARNKERVREFNGLEYLLYMQESQVLHWDLSLSTKGYDTKIKLTQIYRNIKQKCVPRTGEGVVLRVQEHRVSVLQAENFWDVLHSNMNILNTIKLYVWKLYTVIFIFCILL